MFSKPLFLLPEKNRGFSFSHGNVEASSTQCDGILRITSTTALSLLLHSLDFKNEAPNELKNEESKSRMLEANICLARGSELHRASIDSSNEACMCFGAQETSRSITAGSSECLGEVGSFVRGLASSGKGRILSPFVGGPDEMLATYSSGGDEPRVCEVEALCCQCCGDSVPSSEKGVPGVLAYS
eukprot:2286516-Rhodomonas_salina.2